MYPNGDKKRQKSGEQSMKQPIIDENAPGHFCRWQNANDKSSCWEIRPPDLGLYIYDFTKIERTKA